MYDGGRRLKVEDRCVRDRKSMKKSTPVEVWLKMIVLLIAGNVIFSGSVVFAESWSAQRCEAKINRITGKHIKCLLDAESALVKYGRQRKYEKSVAKCEGRYAYAYERALLRWPGACPSIQDSAERLQTRLGQHVGEFSNNVRALISDVPPVPRAGSITLYNRCDVPLKFMSPSNPATLNGVVVRSKGHTNLRIDHDLNAGQNNTILVAPLTTALQCAEAKCQDWTDIHYRPLSANQIQRAGFMWGAPNLTQAAYCQATNAGAQQCSGNSQKSPCCGPSMNYDSTFGTLWEITPASGSQDFLNLSTNFGSSPHSPPMLCSASGADPDDCVAINANVFFNVPVKIEMKGGACSCGSLRTRTEISCLEASCEDAYRHPTDPKQCVCSSGGSRAYLVTYCPEGAELPALSPSFVE